MPEETENYFRIPVPGVGDHDGHRIRTIVISAKEGISALYCGEDKVNITYLFSTDDKFDWTMDKAKEWVKEHATPISKTGGYKPMSDEMKEFFKGLNETLQAAISSPAADKSATDKQLTPEEKAEEEERKKKEQGAATTKALEDIAKALDLTVVEGKEDEASALAKFVKQAQKDTEVLKEVCVKLLERVENLEKNTAVRKSLVGQEGGEGDGEKKGGFDAVVKTLVQKGRVSMV